MKLKIYGDLSYFWQWDLNRKLVVDDGGVCSQVHFCNGTGQALVCAVRTENGIRVADVPNILLQKAEPVKAYLYTDAEDGTRTRSFHRFDVLARSKPEEYIYTETEVLNYAYLDERLKNLEGEGLAQAVADCLKENPVQAGATEEEKKQIQQNKTNIEQLAQDKLDASALPEAVNEALAQAKESGEFKGEKGEKGDPGEPGEPGYTPAKGVDYFTPAEVQAIAEQAAELVEIPEGDTVELDTTLTASGKAADAKAVGDALNGKLSKSGGTMTGKIVFPTGDQNVGFANGGDVKIFGYGTYDGAMHMRMGDTQYPFQIRGKGERAKYNDSEIALMGDIPTDDHINDLINTALSAIPNAAEVAY